MPDMLLDSTASVLKKTLDGTSTRQRALADNIANIDTPGYTRKEVSFESQLRSAMSATMDPDSRMQAIDTVTAQVEEDAVTLRRPDGNNVDIEREMVEVAQNSLQYETSARLLSMKISAVRTAIHEGRR